MSGVTLTGKVPVIAGSDGISILVEITGSDIKRSGILMEKTSGFVPCTIIFSTIGNSASSTYLKHSLIIRAESASVRTSKELFMQSSIELSGQLLAAGSVGFASLKQLSGSVIKTLTFFKGTEWSPSSMLNFPSSFWSNLALICT